MSTTKEHHDHVTASPLPLAIMSRLTEAGLVDGADLVRLSVGSLASALRVSLPDAAIIQREIKTALGLVEPPALQPPELPPPMPPCGESVGHLLHRAASRAPFSGGGVITTSCSAKPASPIEEDLP